MNQKQEERAHFRTVRLRSGLTQSDVTYLIGRKHHDHISKIESKGRSPSLRLIIAYKVIFGAKLSELVPGMVRSRQRRVKRLAKELLPKLMSLPESEIKRTRIAKIKKIIGY